MQYVLSAVPLIAVLFGIYMTSFYNYLLFHGLAEVFSIVIGSGIFMVVWNARRLLPNHYLLFVGIAYLYVAGIDLLHTLAFKGMGVFPGYGADLPTQLWIAARYLESLSLLFATIFLHRKLPHRSTFVAYGIAVGLLLLSIFYWGVFPACFVEGVGLTPFKISSEYVICLVFLAAIGLLIRNSESFNRKVLIFLIASISTAIAQELAFTTYLSVYGPSNMIGHLLKILSFYLLYKAIIETSLVSPYDLLFRDLKKSEEAFRTSERRYRELVQNANSAIIRWKADGTIAFFNEYAQSFSGTAPEEIEGGRGRWDVHPRSRKCESTGADLRVPRAGYRESSRALRPEHQREPLPGRQAGVDGLDQQAGF